MNDPTNKTNSTASPARPTVELVELRSPTNPIITLIKPAEAAAILRVSKTQVYRMLQSGELPGLRFGQKTVRIRRGDLEAFIRGDNGRPE